LSSSRTRLQKRKKGCTNQFILPFSLKTRYRNTDIGCVHLLVNPFSGKKKGRKIGEKVKEILENEGSTVEIHFSAHSGHLIEIAESIQAQPNDVFAVVGGDGSLSEVITGRMKATTERSERFALIPAGTGNSGGK
jgi:diacylglycerol kinase family enzyme